MKLIALLLVLLLLAGCVSISSPLDNGDNVTAYEPTHETTAQPEETTVITAPDAAGSNYMFNQHFAATPSYFYAFGQGGLSRICLTAFAVQNHIILPSSYQGLELMNTHICGVNTQGLFVLAEHADRNLPGDVQFQRVVYFIPHNSTQPQVMLEGDFYLPWYNPLSNSLLFWQFNDDYSARLLAQLPDDSQQVLRQRSNRPWVDDTATWYNLQDGSVVVRAQEDVFDGTNHYPRQMLHISENNRTQMIDDFPDEQLRWANFDFTFGNVRYVLRTYHPEVQEFGEHDIKIHRLDANDNIIDTIFEAQGSENFGVGMQRIGNVILIESALVGGGFFLDFHALYNPATQTMLRLRDVR